MTVHSAGRTSFSAGAPTSSFAVIVSVTVNVDPGATIWSEMSLVADIGSVPSLIVTSPLATDGDSWSSAVEAAAPDRPSVNVPALFACICNTARLPVVETPEPIPVMSSIVSPLRVPSSSKPNMPPLATVRSTRDESNDRST